MTFAGATGNRAKIVNGTYDRMPAERDPGGAPVYKRRGQVAQAGGDVWLFLASDNQWVVGKTEAKDARKAIGWACTEVSVADGTLPHDAPAGGWQVGTGGQGFVTQPAVMVTADD